ncbi:hypothetical protein BKH41_08820 [Helicobacter sp. 12S02232-10]|uniref:hypothetical protein n=1 Tax=Helicobacter sp. 12S02232-10 TaxID=1476197 RepID=UPI000BA54156|nr:hypothetical protein [Helicobacter sp. 12S02232-10]PAF46597.1 hypothetical protein BKH41_08820 [Helicobacter sp. 12S02232-10]
MLKVFLLMIFLYSCYADCESCNNISSVDNIVKAEQRAYENQTQKIINLENLGGNYLLDILGVVFELDREIRLININQQIELILEGEK